METNKNRQSWNIWYFLTLTCSCDRLLVVFSAMESFSSGNFKKYWQESRSVVCSLFYSNTDLYFAVLFYSSNYAFKYGFFLYLSFCARFFIFNESYLISLEHLLVFSRGRPVSLSSVFEPVSNLRWSETSSSRQFFLFCGIRVGILEVELS